MSDKFLNSPEASGAVDEVLKSGRLGLLHLEAQSRLGGRSCLVLGSAPNVSVPTRQRHDALICINGSPWVAQQFGLGAPDLLAMAGFTTAGKKPVPEASMRRLSGLSAEWTLFVEVGDTIEHAKKALTDYGFRVGHFTAISPIERAAIIREACGEDLGIGVRDDRVSNGFFAILFSLWAGASEVIVAGMSLEGGHSYMNEVTPRHHRDGDNRCLELLGGDARVYTTSRELAIRFKIQQM